MTIRAGETVHVEEKDGDGDSDLMRTKMVVKDALMSVSEIK